MQKKIKESNTSTPPKNKSIILEFYQEIGSSKKKPLSEDFVVDLGKKLFDWARTDPEALKIESFFRSRGICRETYYNWIKKFPVFATLYTESLEEIGDRREKLTLQRKASETVWKNTRRLYHKHMDDQFLADKERDHQYTKDKISHQASLNSQLAKETGFYLPVIREDE